MLEEFVTTVLLIVAGLFPIINPPAAAFIVLSIVPYATSNERAELARRITINSLILLAVSLSVGAYVLSFFGISIPVLRVAGGIIITMAGWNLLQSSSIDEDSSNVTAKSTNSISLRAKAFYPLTLPVTVGPGAIAVAIALGTSLPHDGNLSPSHMIGIIVALIILASSIYVCMRFAGHLNRLLGTVGMHVTIRLFAFIIFCIGIQIFWLGISELLKTI